MYHIRRADNHEERSMYANTLTGFEAANIEAGYRAYHTGVPHEVYDDVADRVVNTFLPSAEPDKVPYSSAFGVTKALRGASVTHIIRRLELVIVAMSTFIVMLLLLLLTKHPH